jgi:hypothetical protein
LQNPARIVTALGYGHGRSQLSELKVRIDGLSFGPRPLRRRRIAVDLFAD